MRQERPKWKRELHTSVMPGTSGTPRQHGIHIQVHSRLADAEETVKAQAAELAELRKANVDLQRALEERTGGRDGTPSNAAAQSNPATDKPMPELSEVYKRMQALAKQVVELEQQRQEDRAAMQGLAQRAAVLQHAVKREHELRWEMAQRIDAAFALAQALEEESVHFVRELGQSEEREQQTSDNLHRLILHLQRSAMRSHTLRNRVDKLTVTLQRLGADIELPHGHTVAELEVLLKEAGLDIDKVSLAALFAECDSIPPDERHGGGDSRRICGEDCERLWQRVKDAATEQQLNQQRAATYAGGAPDATPNVVSAPQPRPRTTQALAHFKEAAVRTGVEATALSGLMADIKEAGGKRTGFGSHPVLL